MYIVGSGDILERGERVPLDESVRHVRRLRRKPRVAPWKTCGRVVGGVGIGAIVAGLSGTTSTRPASAAAAASASNGFIGPVLAPGYAGVVVGSSL